MNEFRPIGIIHSPFKEKFGTPYQSQLHQGLSYICPEKSFDRIEFWSDLLSIDYVWIVSHFHLANNNRPKVRPPHLGGNTKCSVFATRSPFRPNPLGLSLVKIHKVELNPHIKIWVEGIDLVDQTPIIDIRPYHPLADRPKTPTDQLSQYSPNFRQVHFSPIVKDKLVKANINFNYDLVACLTDILKLDPRPAYKSEDQKSYWMKFERWDIEFKLEDESIWVTSIVPL